MTGTQYAHPSARQAAGPATTGGALAVGLVLAPVSGPAGRRGDIARHARDHGLTLAHVLELDDDESHTADVLDQLMRLAADPAVTVLVTAGLDTEVAGRLANDLGLDHAPLPRCGGT